MEQSYKYESNYIYYYKSIRKNNQAFKMTSTKFILVKKCIQCSAISPMELIKCAQCNYLFVGEATKEEKEIYDKKIERLTKFKQEVKENKQEEED